MADFKIQGSLQSHEVYEICTSHSPTGHETFLAFNFIWAITAGELISCCNTFQDLKRDG